jgi:hypothetical protein
MVVSWNTCLGAGGASVCVTDEQGALVGDRERAQVYGCSD